jgi:hypothetical protein
MQPRAAGKETEMARRAERLERHSFALIDAVDTTRPDRRTPKGTQNGQRDREQPVGCLSELKSLRGSALCNDRTAGRSTRSARIGKFLCRLPVHNFRMCKGTHEMKGRLEDREGRAAGLAGGSPVGVKRLQRTFSLANTWLTKMPAETQLQYTFSAKEVCC